MSAISPRSEEVDSPLLSLLSKLCGAITGGHCSKDQHSRILAHAVQFITQCPNALMPATVVDHKSLALSESDCVQKINELLKKNNPEASEHFLKLYNNFAQLSIEDRSRHQLMNFLLLLMDADVLKSLGPTPGESVEQAPLAGGDGLLQSLLSKVSLKSNFSSQTSSSRSRSSTNGVHAQFNDLSPSGCSIASDFASAVPNYMETLQRQKEEEGRHDVVRNAIYSFTGIQGKYLKKDVISGRFRLDPLFSDLLSMGEAGMLLRLSELGYYHDQVAKFANTATGFNAMGCMGQAFITMLRQELTDFHGQVALLMDQYNAHRGNSEELTLICLLPWYLKPLDRLQWITKIADACQLLKGGELASVLFNFLENGDPMVDRLVQAMLEAVCGPLVRMISKWMLEGGLEDSFSEFFVESLADVGVDRLWHDKFRLRLNMLPNFLSCELANKILKTGKSINFLREICKLQELVKGTEQLKVVIETNDYRIFAHVEDTSWHAAIDTAYQLTSKHVLDIMVGPYKLLDHLRGMRRYLLLGQGDFVSILIENMKDELDKLGTDIYANDLSAMLDAALRCTNADPEILNHLDVVVQSAYPGDYGWDVISLQYTVDGPLATMLEPTMGTYKALFKPLWRLKHMEFVLSQKIWRDQMGNAKALESMKDEIREASNGLHCLTTEMMHFVHQMQYYVLFEVIECNWAELEKRMQQATALDHILDAHEKFLKTITVGCFAKTSTNLEHNLEAVYETIISLEVWQSKFFDDCFAELKARQDYQRAIVESESAGEFGVTTEIKMERDQEEKLFMHKTSVACGNLNTIANSYEKAVHGFLLALNSSPDPNLHLFGTRLDFNEYYKKRDTSLSVPLTFEAMRMSNVLSIYKNVTGSRYSMQPAQYPTQNSAN